MAMFGQKSQSFLTGLLTGGFNEYNAQQERDREAAKVALKRKEEEQDFFRKQFMSTVEDISSGRRQKQQIADIDAELKGITDYINNDPSHLPPAGITPEYYQGLQQERIKVSQSGGGLTQDEFEVWNSLAKTDPYIGLMLENLRPQFMGEMGESGVPLESEATVNALATTGQFPQQDPAQQQQTVGMGESMGMVPYQEDGTLPNYGAEGQADLGQYIQPKAGGPNGEYNIDRSSLPINKLTQNNADKVPDAVVNVMNSVKALPEFVGFSDILRSGKRDWNSYHNDYLAVDFTVKAGKKNAPKITTAIKEQMRLRGMSPDDYEILDEYNYPSKHASGSGHIHVAFTSKKAADKFMNGGSLSIDGSGIGNSVVDMEMGELQSLQSQYDKLNASPVKTPQIRKEMVALEKQISQQKTRIASAQKTAENEAYQRQRNEESDRRANEAAARAARAEERATAEKPITPTQKAERDRRIANSYTTHIVGTRPKIIPARGDGATKSMQWNNYDTPLMTFNKLKLAKDIDKNDELYPKYRKLIDDKSLWYIPVVKKIVADRKSFIESNKLSKLKGITFDEIPKSLLKAAGIKNDYSGNAYKLKTGKKADAWSGIKTK